MKGIVFLSELISGLLTLGVILPAYSQITSDRTTNTNVNSIGNKFTIINGIQKMLAIYRYLTNIIMLLKLQLFPINQ